MGLTSTQKGKVVESLIAATCILESDGRLSVSIPFVDDEGIDIVITLKGGGRTIFIQVKSRFTLIRGRYYRSQVRKKNFVPRKDLFIIFAYYDKTKALLGDTLWLIPSTDFVKSLKGQTNKRVYVFQSRFNSQKDMWKSYKMTLKDFPSKMLEMLS